MESINPSSQEGQTETDAPLGFLIDTEGGPVLRFLMRWHGEFHEVGEFPAACAFCNDYRNQVETLRRAGLVE